MTRILYKCFFICCFFLSLSFSTLAQKKASADSLPKNYSKEVLMGKQFGKLLFLSKIDDKSFVLIKWKHGFYAIGTLINSKENGHWYLFRKNGTLKKDVFFSNGEANQVKEYDRKDNSID